MRTPDYMKHPALRFYFKTLSYKSTVYGENLLEQVGIAFLAAAVRSHTSMTIEVEDSLYF